ncbi:MAG: response regulator [Flavobacteriaceae bacterium]|jgi:CheY-like chemotaxis protein|nr:MAG: transcriptional regulator [Polaribacter sp. BACL8 MAG-120531-bin13]KRP03878.1 MAG: transcriptional regulator [Polaribacter sp. BACL8 MAG-120619-bin41]MBT5394255.1 response regulator [Flavobacteriaceae bacterium]NQV62293.1 response regulator [Cryomorphaceae bacterium]MCO4779426.1 response regulator [Flavobacteriaceae bacterium]|tara:strand:- start:1455 stop:1859 length:405 start_codon:yes stop_codon:yes gene_type:complete
MTILLIEDDAIEILKFNRSLIKLREVHELIEAHNGENALDILAENSQIDLILLDLNMPKMNGFEFLKQLRTDPNLKYIPTVVLTTSINRSDLKQAYSIGIAGYLVKPLKYEDYVLKIASLLNYWKQNELVKGTH